MSELGPDWWAYAVLAVVLVVAAVTDVRTGKIYNWTSLPGVAIGLIGHWIMGGVFGIVPEDGAASSMGLVDSLLGLLAGFVPMWLAWRAGGIGGGDAKVMGAVGALAGWRFALSAIFYGFAVAAVMALIIMLRKRIARKTLGRVWHFLWLLVIRAKPGNPATEESPTLPFGLALCIGSAIALGLLLACGPNQHMFLLGF